MDKIGEEHVIQVVMDGASNYVADRRLLGAKKTIVLITLCCTLFRFAKGEELGKLAITRFFTTYLTLKSMQRRKENCN